MDKSKEIVFIFPHIHSEQSWEITSLSSLWRFFIFDNIAEPLIRVNTKSEFIPALASQWSYSNDGKEITFKISKHYKFHSNKEISPNDVLNSLKRVFTLKNTAHSNMSELLCDNNSISLKEDEIRICLKKYVNGFLFNLATPEYGIVPSNYSDLKGNIASLKNLSGPYQVKNVSDSEIHLEAFLSHPLIKENSIRNATIKQITNFDESIEYFKKHNSTVLVGTDYNSSLKLKNLKGNISISAPSLTEFFVPNYESPLFKNRILRRAFSQIIQEAKKNLEYDSKLAELAKGVFTPASLASLEQEITYNEDIKKLENKTITVVLFDWMKGAPLLYQLKTLLTKYKINLEIDLVEQKNFLTVLKENRYDLIYIYSGVSALDPIVELIYLSQHVITSKNFVKSHLTNDIENMKFERDRGKYSKMMKETHKKILEEVVLIPIVHTKMVYLSSENVKLIDINHFDGSFNIWDWTNAN